MKVIKKMSIVMCIMVIMGVSVTAYAASKTRAFTYNFKHQLAVKGNYKATKSDVDFSIYTTSNSGEDTYFQIKQFKYNFWGANSYKRSGYINCKAKSKGSCSIETDKGTKYTYEFWKPTAIGYVVGSGEMTY